MEAIKRLIDSKDPEVRSVAIRALAGGGGGDPVAVAVARPAPAPVVQDEDLGAA